MIYNVESHRYLAKHPYWALSWGDRLRGMIGRRFKRGELDAMVFFRCNAVHSMWMRIPLDLVFLDRDSTVVQTVHNFKPWHLPVICPKAVTVIELPCGMIEATRTERNHHINLNSNLSAELIEKATKEAIVNAELLPLTPPSEEAAAKIKEEIG